MTPERLAVWRVVCAFIKWRTLNVQSPRTLVDAIVWQVDAQHKSQYPCDGKQNGCNEESTGPASSVFPAVLSVPYAGARFPSPPLHDPRHMIPVGITQEVEVGRSPE